MMTLAMPAASPCPPTAATSSSSLSVVDYLSQEETFALEAEICQRLVRLSCEKMIASRNGRGGARLHKNLLILHLVRRARRDSEMLPYECLGLLKQHSFSYCSAEQPMGQGLEPAAEQSLEQQQQDQLVPSEVCELEEPDHSHGQMLCAAADEKEHTPEAAASHSLALCSSAPPPFSALLEQPLEYKITDQSVDRHFGGRLYERQAKRLFPLTAASSIEVGEDAQYLEPPAPQPLAPTLPTVWEIWSEPTPVPKREIGDSGSIGSIWGSPCGESVTGGYNFYADARSEHLPLPFPTTASDLRREQQQREEEEDQGCFHFELDEQPPTHFTCPVTWDSSGSDEEDELSSSGDEEEHSRKRKRILTDGAKDQESKVLRRLSPVKPLLQQDPQSAAAKDPDGDGDSGVDVNGACDGDAEEGTWAA